MKLKTASCQFAYWESGKLRIANYLTGKTFATNPVTLNLLSFFATPSTLQKAFVEFDSYSRESVAASIQKLIEAQLLLEQGSAEWKRDKQVESSWARWLPEGGFHFMTKNTPFVGLERPIEEKMKMLSNTRTPPQFKRIATASPIRLSAPEIQTDTFFETLHARRTHREFSKAAVSLESVSNLLQSTWGVQGYLDTNVFGKLPHKTSPSGGARHPVEVYLMALRVKGLSKGIYHYNAKDHLLAKISEKASAHMASEYCAGQPYFGEAAALFIMTAVFARTMWKYGRARAYRVVLLETGHLGQTFCLTATRLGLAPFSTAALKDSVIEKDLGIDGISESVLYVTGVGVPPGQ
jgi:SagB-type dehydrogenase family enzyme